MLRLTMGNVEVSQQKAHEPVQVLVYHEDGKEKSGFAIPADCLVDFRDVINKFYEVAVKWNWLE